MNRGVHHHVGGMGRVGLRPSLPDLLVRGAVDLAAALKISPLIISLTIVSFGASAPEMSIALRSALAGSGAEYLLLRTSWLYAPWGKNFVRTIARLASERPTLRVVDDQRGRPTSAEGLAETTLALLEAGARGVLHATDGGDCTWFGFAQAIVHGLGLPARVEPGTTAEFPRPARRPAYSVLDLSETEALVGPMRPWEARWADVLGRLERPL